MKSVNHVFRSLLQRRVDRYFTPPVNITEREIVYFFRTSHSTCVVSPSGDNGIYFTHWWVNERLLSNYNCSVGSCEIKYSIGTDYENCCLPESNAVYFGRMILAWQTRLRHIHKNSNYLHKNIFCIQSLPLLLLRETNTLVLKKSNFNAQWELTPRNY